MKKDYLHKGFSCATLAFLLFLLLPAGDLVGAEVVVNNGTGTAIGERMTTLVFQLAVILCAAKIGGFLVSRYLRLPEVLGELIVGIIIGPYMLGSIIGIFPAPATGSFPVTPELYGIATFASIILLYLAGLETDLSMFLRYSLKGSIIGLAGVVVSFILGDVSAVWLNLADSYMAPSALFLGTISTATSVGITARILGERQSLDSPEGTTVLAAAVIDDVLGIIILAIVVGMAKVGTGTNQLQWHSVAGIALKAFLFWIVCTAAGIFLAAKVSKMFEWFGSRQTMAVLSLGLALLLAGLSEKAGLAMIIGAYITGLSLSRVDSAHELRMRLEPVYHTLVGIFFVVMGMMVNLAALEGVIVVGLIFSAIAILAKVCGCGLPALLMRFNSLGALRIGMGMLPRGEVALIVAGVGLSSGFVNQQVFGIAIMMTLITTVIAPVVLVRIFDHRSGVKEQVDEQNLQAPLSMELPNEAVADFLLARIIQMFEQEECYVCQPVRGSSLYHIRKDEVAITVRREQNTLSLSCRQPDRLYARLVVFEALADLTKMLQGLNQLENNNDLRTQVNF